MSFSRAAVFALSLATVLQAADTRLVRETEALTPAEEQARLHVPAGFEIQLFVSEPMINKPINMAFDAGGRLWVSSTVEYPYSAKRERWADDQGTRVKDSRDAIKILSDNDGDGKADKVTDFADGLNIPTGVVPWHKPEHKAGCIAWSIPNIWYFADTDGDDKADVREVLFGPLGYEKDTHGMCSSFRLGLDGWVYATHGFNNTSHFEVKAERWRGAEKMTNDEGNLNASSPSFGRRLDLHSGNVFRFKPDGSRVEPWTWGQVNPFGLCWDRYSNLYSADCHSSPIYQLIRGAHYPSFGKPHDGLGFAPVMCEHSHGSTGICGIVYLDGGVWGPEWDDHTFVGNVVTSTINHDRVTFHGSTPKANEQPDFLTSDDPWFRPVDLQLGPDNALYIADFYNKIIGHYEVPLEHPGRDKERGRIWRVVKMDVPSSTADFTAMSSQQIAQELGHGNLTRRHLALGEVRQRGKQSWLKDLLPCIDSSGKMQPQGNTPPMEYAGPGADTVPHDSGIGVGCEATLQAAYALWACAYLGERSNVYEVLRGLHTGGIWVHDDTEETPERTGRQFGLLMSQATLILGSQERLHPWEKWGLGIIFDCRGSAAGRAATQTLLQRPDFLKDDPVWRTWTVRSLIELCDQMQEPREPKARYMWEDPADTQYIHAMRILLRDWLSQAWFTPDDPWLSDAQAITCKPWFLAVMKSVPTPQAAKFLLAHLDQGLAGDAATWQHIARHSEAAELSGIIQQARERTRSSFTDSTRLLQAIHDGLSERGAPANAELLAWAQELAVQLLGAQKQRPDPAWTALGAAGSAPKWALRPRACADGAEAQVLQSMSGRGGDEEKRTGVLRSKAFVAPAKLTFWINGHRGFPKTPAHDNNLVRVVDAKSGEMLASVFPPRNDVCQLAVMDLAAHVGKTVRLEMVDGDDGKAYAWLGITRIEPGVISVNDFQGEDSSSGALKTLAVMLQHTAPAGLREKLAAYLPPRPAPPPRPVSPEQRKLLDAQIAARLDAYAKSKTQGQNGEKVFKANCAACHQIGGVGGLIGPQLDGIGARGPERLCEDILDPNRNVDAHFHLHTLTLKNGTTMSGFLKAEAGQVLILADAAGQEQRVSKGDVAKDETMPMSLMPPVFGQTLGSDDFSDLLGYLLSHAPAH